MFVDMAFEKLVSEASLAGRVGRVDLVGSQVGLERQVDLQIGSTASQVELVGMAFEKLMSEASIVVPLATSADASAGQSIEGGFTGWFQDDELDAEIDHGEPMQVDLGRGRMEAEARHGDEADTESAGREAAIADRIAANRAASVAR